MPAQFKISAADANAVAQLEKHFNIPHFIATTLAARGITTIEAAEEFLSPSLDRDWLDPYIIPGLSEVADVVEESIRNREHIIVSGDFDVDGISATAVLTRGLRALGAYVTPFIPLRFEEGYSLTPASYERIKGMNPELIITVDCGISCKEEVAAIVADGVKVVITDHHEAADQVPEGVPVADPKTVEDCPSSILAGVGVALKLVQVLGGRFGYPNLWRSYTDLATLGTIADLMPMRGENRALVADGIARIANQPRPCLAALLGQAGASDKQISATNLSFSVVPRLNAAGRMGDATPALDLLMTDSFDEACKLAANLEQINDKRRTIEAELSEAAQVRAGEVYHGQRALVVAGEGWHEGVKGIVASRLVHMYGVPCLLFTIDGDEARGSGRTVGQVNLFAAVESCSDLLTRFGGHEAACGVTLPADNLPEFTRRLCAYMDALPPDAFHPLVNIDTTVALDELTIENVDLLERLAPFGQENKTPVLLARNVSLANARAVGAEKNHFSCLLSDGETKVAAIMFHCDDIDNLLHVPGVVNAAFEVQVDEWRGRRSVKAMLKSLAPVQMCGALQACLDPSSTKFVTDLYAASDEACEDAEDTFEDVEAFEADRAANRETWRHRAQTAPEKLEADIIRAIIGECSLHASQREVLDSLAAGESVLAVMATGRGKSLLFQVHAALTALRDGQASLFVYPLRALIADQAFHLNSALARFGISVSTLTGESTPQERNDIYAALAQGTCDIVLTTPEFLSFHADDIAASGRIGFVAVDEAHHIGLTKLGQRPAYKTLADTVPKLGNPRVLALTATANGDVAREITSVLPIKKCVFDRAERPNLVVNDKRGLKGRDDYLAKLIASGEKTVIYANSREQSIAIARALRQKVPQLALLIGFYNAGLNRAERTRIEDMFRTGALSVLVSTSAFGEGVNIPDVRHVVLYGIPYNEIEFNQMSGRAGRDGNRADIHLLFNRSDVEINEGILGETTPNHDRMAQVYRTLRTKQREMGEGFFVTSFAQIAEEASTKRFPISARAAECAVAVFRELGLIETHVTYSAGTETRSVRVVEGAKKVELTDSVRYREGLGEREIFEGFRDWVLGETLEALQTRIQCPILPACTKL